MNRFQEDKEPRHTWEPELVGNVADAIRDPGWAVMTVGNDVRPWAYTIGLTDRGQPELVVVNMRTVFAREVLDTAASGLIMGMSLTDVGRVSDLTFGPVDQHYLDDGMVAAWTQYYSQTQNGRRAKAADFVQLMPGPTHSRKCHRRGKTDLSVPRTESTRTGANALRQPWRRAA